jgi:hypothetical protein
MLLGDRGPRRARFGHSGGGRHRAAAFASTSINWR